MPRFYLISCLFLTFVLVGDIAFILLIIRPLSNELTSARARLQHLGDEENVLEKQFQSLFYHEMNVFVDNCQMLESRSTLNLPTERAQENLGQQKTKADPQLSLEIQRLQQQLQNPFGKGIHELTEKCMNVTNGVKDLHEKLSRMIAQMSSRPDKMLTNYV